MGLDIDFVDLDRIVFEKDDPVWRGILQMMKNRGRPFISKIRYLGKGEKQIQLCGNIEGKGFSIWVERVEVKPFYRFIYKEQYSDCYSPKFIIGP